MSDTDWRLTKEQVAEYNGFEWPDPMAEAQAKKLVEWFYEPCNNPNHAFWVVHKRAKQYHLHRYNCSDCQQQLRADLGLT